MRHFQINAVKARNAGECCGNNEFALELFEKIVAREFRRVRPRRLVGEARITVEHGMARGRPRAGEAVAARVGELEYGEEAVRGAKSLLVRLAALGKQRLEARHGAFVDPKLARIGAAFGRDGASFKPDKLRAAGAKSAVAPERQLARRAIEFAVTAFHRVDCE